jgi:hypothetical protein
MGREKRGMLVGSSSHKYHPSQQTVLGIHGLSSKDFSSLPPPPFFSQMGCKKQLLSHPRKNNSRTIRTRERRFFFLSEKANEFRFPFERKMRGGSKLLKSACQLA